MSIFLVFCVLIATLVLGLAGGGCTGTDVGSREQGQQIAEQFVKNEATFRFGGIPETLKLTGTASAANGWKYTIEFDSRHGGYGNRTGQIVAQVIAHHVAVVTIQSGQATSAIMDAKWDMIKQCLL